MRKIFSILLAALLLMSSLGISVSAHYCRGIVAKVNIGLGNTKASCGMENSLKGCSDSESIASNCCSNKTLQIKIDDNYTSSFFKKINNPDFAISHLFSSDEVHALSFFQYQYFNFPNAPPCINEVSLSFIRTYRI